jgi:hypothetical protein
VANNKALSPVQDITAENPSKSMEGVELDQVDFKTKSIRFKDNMLTEKFRALWWIENHAVNVLG